MTTRTATATEMRVHMGEILRDVSENGTNVLVQRAGRTIAVVIPVEQYENREEQDRKRRWARSWELIRRSQEASARSLRGREIPPPEDLIREGREERDARIIGDLRREDLR